MINRTRFMVKERVRMLRLTDKFDIFDPDTGEQIAYAKEEPPGLATIGRLLFKKQSLPNCINFYELGTPDNEATAERILTMSKGFSFFRSHFHLSTDDGRDLGSLRSKVFTIGGGLKIFAPSGDELADLSGNFIGWDFSLSTSNGREIGRITKKWAGGVKEFFTTADNYLVEAYDDAPKGTGILLLCSAIVIDSVFKEKS